VRRNFQKYQISPVNKLHFIRTKKILSTRLFEEDGKRWMKSVKDLKYEILCVSQFTLYGKLNKGNKPDFHHAMGGEKAKEMYDNLLDQLGKDYDPSKIQDGVFGAMMNVQM
jgi:D-tyrosyl-tRNA(Tyr) deacylase